MSGAGECAIDPQKSRSDPTLGPLAFLVAVPPDLRALNRAAGQQGRRLFQKEWVQGYDWPSRSDPVALAGPVLGAPQAVMTLEKLGALGARRVLFMGWAGSLDPDLKPGELLIPDRAVSEEGTSRHYVPEPDPRPAGSWVRQIRQALDREGVPWRGGSVWTTDAPYRETWEKIRSYQRRGVAAVEMETAALFTVGCFRSLEVAALLIVSDELSGTRWRHGFRDPRFLEARRRLRAWIIQTGFLLPGS